MEEINEIDGEIAKIEQQIEVLRSRKEGYEGQIQGIYRKFDNYLNEYLKRFGKPVKSLVHFYRKNEDNKNETVFWHINFIQDDITEQVTDLPRIEDPERKAFFHWYLEKTNGYNTYFSRELKR